MSTTARIALGSLELVVTGDPVAIADVCRVAEHVAAGAITVELVGERQRIVDALARSAGNQSAAAKLLGMPRRTLVKRLRAYGIPRPRSDNPVPDAGP